MTVSLLTVATSEEDFTATVIQATNRSTTIELIVKVHVWFNFTFKTELCALSVETYFLAIILFMIHWVPGYMEA